MGKVRIKIGDELGSHPMLIGQKTVSAIYVNPQPEGLTVIQACYFDGEDHIPLDEYLTTEYREIDNGIEFED